MASKYTKTENLLADLVDSEHGDCGENTCCIAEAIYHEKYLWAIECFSSSGAASEEFERLYKKLTSSFHARAEKERQYLVKLPNKDCPHCSATIWDIDANDCDSCGKDFPNETAVLVKSDGGRSVSIKVAKDATGTYGGFMYVTHEQAKDILQQLTDLGFAPIP